MHHHRYQIDIMFLLEKVSINVDMCQRKWYFFLTIPLISLLITLYSQTLPIYPLVYYCQILMLLSFLISFFSILLYLRGLLRMVSHMYYILQKYISLKHHHLSQKIHVINRVYNDHVLLYILLSHCFFSTNLYGTKVHLPPTSCEVMVCQLSYI